jgi:hypothetical protein
MFNQFLQKMNVFSLDNWNGFGDEFRPPAHNLRGWIRQAGGEVILCTSCTFFVRARSCFDDSF